MHQKGQPQKGQPRLGSSDSRPYAPSGRGSALILRRSISPGDSHCVR